MKIHPQLISTVKLLEDLRRNKRLRLLKIRFGECGLEWLKVEEINLSASKLVDKGDAAKIN